MTRQDVEAAVWRSTPKGGRSDFDLNPTAQSNRPQRRRLAAVLCPLVARDEGYTVILTRRADHLSSHAGQIAFPGGKVDSDDTSPMVAALREAEEEIGLTRAEVDIVGAIDPYVTGTGFEVRPFIGLVSSAFRPLADENEVAEVFEVPFDFLMDPRNHRRESRMFNGYERRYWAIPFEERYIWGATAGMLKNLADRVALARSQRSWV
ncbi:MAG: CoA pyrophosphatase [Rhodobacteraceae bacterium]|nr:CoA pyrophosphatase [Paracoccaceae bacterium]